MAVLLIAIIAPFVVFTVPQVVGAEHSYVVISGSMTPAIAVNDAIIVNEVSPTSIDVGDVIVFHARSEIDSDNIDVTSHRVVEIVRTDNGLAFKTKGDANEEPDPGLVPADALVGRMAFMIPYIGYVITFASSKIGFITLVAIPLGLLILGEVYDLARAARNSRDEADDAPTEPDERAKADGGTDAGRVETDEQSTSDEWQWGD